MKLQTQPSHTTPHPNHKSIDGFTLVELSIVLVILGLLVGGVLTGQSLIRAAELRSIMSDQQRYVTATYAFRDKYFALPGDMSNATSFWGKDNANCPADTGTAATNGVCNGDGNGFVLDNSGIAGGPVEHFQFWRQLAAAGLVEGSYTGLNGPSSLSEVLLGINAPKSKLSGAGWNTRSLAAYHVGNPNTFAGEYGNFFQFGTAVAGSNTYGAIVKPEEIWNIDTKIDDGKPGTGKLVPRDLTGINVANACTTATSSTDYASNYNLAVSTVNCSFYFLRQF